MTTRRIIAGLMMVWLVLWACGGHSQPPVDPMSREVSDGGDLVFFRLPDGKRHVAIYLDRGQFAHASTRRGGDDLPTAGPLLAGDILDGPACAELIIWGQIVDHGRPWVATLATDTPEQVNDDEAEKKISQNRSQ